MPNRVTTTGFQVLRRGGNANALVTVSAVQVLRGVTDIPAGGSTYSIDLTIPAGKVTADLTSFPVLVDLANLPDAFWNAVKSDGGDIRVQNGSGTFLPIDLLYINVVTKKGRLFFLANSIPAGSDSTWTISGGNPYLNLLPANDSLGRNAVWAGYHRVYMMDGTGVDRTGAGETIANMTDAARFFVSPSRSPDVNNAHQGVAFDGAHYYIVDTNWIGKYDLDWNLVAQNTTPISSSGIALVDHLGDPEVVDDVLYVPLEKYPATGGVYNNQHIARYSTATLAFISSSSMSAQGHEASSLAYNPADGFLYCASYTDGSKLWKYTLDGVYQGELPLSGPTRTRIQGITFWRGKLYVGDDQNVTSSVFEYALDGTSLGSVFNDVRATNKVHEGLSSFSGGLLRLVDESTASYVYRLQLVDDCGLQGYSPFIGNNNTERYSLSGLTFSQTWTISIAYMPVAADDGNSALISRAIAATTANTNRATLAARNSGLWGLWNSANTWMDGPAIVPHKLVRVAATHEGTTRRSLFVEGVQVGTQTGISARPVSPGTGLFIGGEGQSTSERPHGALGYAYVVNAVLPNEVLAAEAVNWVNPADFYVVNAAPPIEPITVAAGPRSSLRFRGKTPSIAIDQFVEPGAGHLVFTGRVPEVRVQALIEVEPGSGSLAFSGKTPGIYIGSLVIASEPGGVQFRGKTPSIFTNFGSIASQQANLTLGRVEPLAGVSQQAVTALARIVPDAKVPQQSAMTLGKIVPPVGVSQMAHLFLIKPVIQPSLLPEPEVGGRESWTWKTDVIVADDGTEQRIALRDQPRRSFSEKIIYDDIELVNKHVKFMLDRFGQTFVLPLYVYRTKLTQHPMPGDHYVYFDTSRIDLKPGSYLYIFDGDNYQLLKAGRVYPDRVYVDLPIMTEYDEAVRIMPAAVCIASNNTSFDRSNPDYYGKMDLNAEEVVLSTPFIRDDNTQVLETFTDLPVLNRRAIGSEFGTAHDTGLERVDFDTGPITLRNSWKHGKNTFARRFIAHRRRPEDLDWWKRLADYAKGSQRPFLLPSGREDFETVAPAQPGGTRIVVEGIKYGPTFFGRNAFRRIAISSAAGVHYATVWSATRDGDKNILHFDPPYPTGPGWGASQKASFLLQVRIADDKVELEHQHLHSFVSLNLRTVDD